MPASSTIHPVTFALGFLCHTLDLLVQHPAYAQTPVGRFARFSDLLLHQWGVTLQEIEPAHQLLGELLDGHHPEGWEVAYKTAAWQFASATTERASLWIAHFTALACFQNLQLLGKLELVFKQHLYLSYIQEQLGLEENTSQQAREMGISLALMATIFLQEESS